MIIKLTDKNKEVILINTDHVVSITKNGNGLNGISSKISFANVDRMESVLFSYETPGEICNLIEYKELESRENTIKYVVDKEVEESNTPVKKK